MLKMSNGSRLDKLNVWKKGRSIRKDKCRRNGLTLLLVLLLLQSTCFKRRKQIVSYFVYFDLKKEGDDKVFRKYCF